MRERIANLTSNILNPFLIGLILIVLASFEATTSGFDTIKWSLILTALSVLSIFLFVVYLVRHDRLDSIFANVREQRTKVYVLAIVLAVVSCIILLSLKAPLMLLAAFVASLSANAIFMLVNLRWKISVHTGFITAAVTLLFILYGLTSLASIVLIPLVAWARMQLEHHSLAQVFTGALLAIVIVVAVFYLFGLI
jgi:membrane-associated phospholipid phosphatase